MVHARKKPWNIIVHRKKSTGKKSTEKWAQEKRGQAKNFKKWAQKEKKCFHL